MGTGIVTKVELTSLPGTVLYIHSLLKLLQHAFVRDIKSHLSLEHTEAQRVYQGLTEKQSQ